MPEVAEAVIAGAGIAGVAAAYHLSVKQRLSRVVLADDRAPLTLTSDKSTECYRNWWPGPDGAMVALVNRSIDLLEELARESGNIFNLNRRGYLYVTADPDRVSRFRRAGELAARQGAGRLREGPDVPPGTGDPDPPSLDDPLELETTGADLILDQAALRERFPYLSERAVAAMHVRRSGWLSGQQLGMFLLERAREHGVRLRRARVESVDTSGGRVRGVELSDGDRLSTGTLVNAAGPYLASLGARIGVSLPVYSELHAKLTFEDVLGAVPRDAPLLIWSDPQVIEWTPEERALLLESDETRWMVEELPAGAHLRPEGGPGSRTVLALWAYKVEPGPVVFPPRFDTGIQDIVLRGLSAMVPGLGAYRARAPRAVVDGGYYTKTGENRPLIGPLPVGGAYVIGALSGFGLMAACAAGELVAAHVMGRALPAYAPSFALSRYDDPDYRILIQGWEGEGEL